MLMNYIDLSYFYRLYDTYFMVWRIYHLLRKHKLTITDITENMIETLLIGANIRCHRKKTIFYFQNNPCSGITTCPYWSTRPPFFLPVKKNCLWLKKNNKREDTMCS